MFVPWRIYNLDFKRKIWTWTGIRTSDLQITSLALLPIGLSKFPFQFMFKSKFYLFTEFSPLLWCLRRASGRCVSSLLFNIFFIILLSRFSFYISIELIYEQKGDRICPKQIWGNKKHSNYFQFSWFSMLTTISVIKIRICYTRIPKSLLLAVLSVSWAETSQAQLSQCQQNTLQVTPLFIFNTSNNNNKQIKK